MIASTMSEMPARAIFHTTSWSLVAGAAGESAGSFELLCKQYSFPVYAVARRSGHGVEEAKDLTQGFFRPAAGEGGGQVVFTNVPMKRLDLGRNLSAVR